VFRHTGEPDNKGVINCYRQGQLTARLAARFKETQALPQVQALTDAEIAAEMARL
jgi:hypothetical protein